MKNNNKSQHLTPAHVCGGDDGPAVRELLTKVGDKWSIFLIVSLAKMPGRRARFSELQRAIPGVSQRMLTLTLRNLERDGMILREVFPEVPPRVEYEITALGESLLTPMHGLVDWVGNNWKYVKNARTKYDGTQKKKT